MSYLAQSVLIAQQPIRSSRDSLLQIIYYVMHYFTFFWLLCVKYFYILHTYVECCSYLIV